LGLTIEHSPRGYKSKEVLENYDLKKTMTGSLSRGSALMIVLKVMIIPDFQPERPGIL